MSIVLLWRHFKDLPNKHKMILQILYLLIKYKCATPTDDPTSKINFWSLTFQFSSKLVDLKKLLKFNFYNHLCIWLNNDIFSLNILKKLFCCHFEVRSARTSLFKSKYLTCNPFMSLYVLNENIYLLGAGGHKCPFLIFYIFSYLCQYYTLSSKKSIFAPDIHGARKKRLKMLTLTVDSTITYSYLGLKLGSSLLLTLHYKFEQFQSTSIFPLYILEFNRT